MYKSDEIKLPESFLENDIEGFSYFLGFLMSDGCMKTDVRLLSSDEDIIKKLSERLGNISVKVQDRSHLNSNWKPIYRISLPKSYKLLLNSYGVTQDKDEHSLDNLKRDIEIYSFLRGFLDGDGSIKTTKASYGQRLDCLVFLGREKLLKSIMDRVPGGVLYKVPLKDGRTRQLYDLRFVGESARELAHKMWDNSTIHMNRKYQKYLECVENPKPQHNRMSKERFIRFRHDGRKNPWFCSNGKISSPGFATEQEAINWKIENLMGMN